MKACREEKGEVEENFEIPAICTFPLLPYWLYKLGRCLRPLTGDSWSICIAIGTIACSGFLYSPFVKLATTVYRQFMTRKIAMWRWLRQNGASRAF